MSSRSLRLGFAATASTAFIAILIACSSKDPLPPPYEDPTNQLSDAAPRRDAATDGGKGTDGGDGGIEYPKSCSNTIRDSKETDVDCGGNECPKCIDGKVCVADTDCAGGSCVNKQCVTPACTDGVTNGGESDVDCGGSTCARCTTGKKCGSGADCLSGTCVNQACGCPAGMAIVPKASGGAYCIDSAEVTKGQYNRQSACRRAARHLPSAYERHVRPAWRMAAGDGAAGNERPRVQPRPPGALRRLV